jgi:hypothetical protein
MKKILFILTAGLAFFAAGQGFAQVPSATRSTTAQSSTSAGRFGADIDNYMGTRNWPGMGFDRHFFFLGGRYQGTVTPSLGYATRFGDYYLGLYFRGTVVQGANTHHSGVWDSQWDTDGNGSSGFALDDTVAVLFGVPGIGGFRFDWIASDASGAAHPRFERFKGVMGATYNGQTVDYAQGTASGPMTFLLSYGNTFAGKYKLDVTTGYATSESVDVTGGQIGPHIFKFNQTQNSKIYLKLGGGYNFDTFSVDGNYSLIVMPGRKWEQTIGYADTSFKAEGNFQHIINLSYSKTFNFDEKLSMGLNPNLKFDILFEKDVVETESGKTDMGRQRTITIIPTIAIGLQYKASSRLSLYTGTTIQLFEYASRDGKKGADGINAVYLDGSGFDIIQGEESGFDIGASLALTDTLSLDFNVRTLINSIFVSASPMVDLYLTFKPGVKTPQPPVTASVVPAAIAAAPAPAPQAEPSPVPPPASAPEPARVPAEAAAPGIIVQPQSARYEQYSDAHALTVTAVSGDGGELSYQWYWNTQNSNTGGTMIVEATSVTFTPPTSIPGTTYYYVIVTNTNNSARDKKTAAVTSGTAAVTVTAPVNESPADELTGNYDELIDE